MVAVVQVATPNESRAAGLSPARCPPAAGPGQVAPARSRFTARRSWTVTPLGCLRWADAWKPTRSRRPRQASAPAAASRRRYPIRLAGRLGQAAPVDRGEGRKVVDVGRLARAPRLQGAPRVRGAVDRHRRE